MCVYDSELPVVIHMTLPDGVFGPRGAFLPKRERVFADVSEGQFSALYSAFNYKPQRFETREEFWQRMWGA